VLGAAATGLDDDVSRIAAAVVAATLPAMTIPDEADVPSGDSGAGNRDAAAPVAAPSVGTASPDRHERVMRAALLFQLKQEQADALDDLLAIVDERASGSPVDADEPAADTTESMATAARLLADADVADAFYNDIAGLDAERADDAAALGEALRAAAAAIGTTRTRPAARAAGSWLIAQARHTQSRSSEVEAYLDEALDADPTYRPALELAAHYASDRGDAPKAMSLARRAGVPDNDPWVQMLSSMVPRARPDLGRNDPCWCGSGRKYKQCHLNNTDTTLEQRADWLWHKAIDHLQDSRWQHRLVAVGDAMLGLDATTYDSMGFAMTDAVVADLVLFSDGGWADFLAVRGPLLPADERALAEQWATEPRTLYEVVSFEPGETVSVRAADGDATTETVVVAELTYSRNAQVGDLIYAHVTHVGDTAQFFGGLVPIFTPEQREELAALLADGADGVAIAEMIHRWDTTGGDGAPRVTTSEGEPLVFLTTSFRVDDTDTIVAALDGRAELARADSTDDVDEVTADAAPLDDVPHAFGGSTAADSTVIGQWAEHVRVRDADWIRGTVVLHDDRLVLRTNSEVRHARLRALLDEILPDAEILDEHRQTIDPPP
jgi:tetratricopeptide (TPR) repeat protein